MSDKCISASHEPRATPRATGGERVAFGVILLLYLAVSLLLFDQIEEDAFIYFRLVGNWVHGDGLVFNRGGQPVEAGSSLPWMVLLALFWKAPWDVVITAKLLGIAAGCGCLWMRLWERSSEVFRVGVRGRDRRVRVT